MDIKYFGHASFLIKGKSASVVTDPFDTKMVGLKFPSVSADIVTISHDHEDHNQRQLVIDSPLVISHAGEYEKHGVRITGILVFHDNKQGAERGKNILYKIEIDDISIVHCGDLGHQLSDEVVEELGNIHILMVPVGGVYTITAKDACEVVADIDPSIVIPMHYNDPRLNQKAFGGMTPVGDFIKAMGVTPAEPEKKLSVKRESFTEDMKLIVLDIA